MASSIFSWYKRLWTLAHRIWVKISPCHLRNNSVKSVSVQYVHVDMTIANDILKKCTRGSFQLWGKGDHDLAVTIIHLGFVGSLPLDEQQLWFPNQQVHDPDSWTVPHLLQLKMEYDVLVNKHRCKVQEMHTVQDHPPPPSEFLLLPPLDSLYKTHVWNQESPQPGDSRPVMTPSQRALSKQMMKYWGPWETNMQKSTNSRMLQKLAFHTQQTIKETSTQDLDPLPLANNDHVSVFPFEMYALESGEPPSRTLNWNPQWILIHIKTSYQRPSVPVFVTFFISALSEITYKHAELSRRLHRLMIGWYTVWVAFWVRWVVFLLLVL